MSQPLVAVIMGSKSDFAAVQDAVHVLKEFGVDFDCKIVSAHRTPEIMVQYAQSAESRGIRVIIAAAGGAAHLPGMVASLTNLPVVGIPVASNGLNGLDSLLSIVQMPPGIPVGTMAINGARNAGLYAMRILATSDPTLLAKLEKHRVSMTEKVAKMNEELASELP